MMYISMSVEMEAKLRVPDNFNLEEFLLKKGGVLLGREEQVDIYLDFEDLRLKRSGRALRIRFTAAGHRLTYKGPLIDAPVKAREEIEVEVSDGSSLLRIFEHLGFRAFIRVKKARSRVLLNGLIYEIDDVEGLGRFVEVEVRTAEELNRAREVLTQAGLEWSPIMKSYAELLDERNRI
ncbi:MAG: class IV adenylate cyclase [Nitrososphaeria archaeon]